MDIDIKEEKRTLTARIEEQRELYKKYTSEADRKLIMRVVEIIQNEIEKGELKC